MVDGFQNRRVAPDAIKCVPFGDGDICRYVPAIAEEQANDRLVSHFKTGVVELWSDGENRNKVGLALFRMTGFRSVDWNVNLYVVDAKSTLRVKKFFGNIFRHSD